jgi:anti-sigma regulatory factor (Ser/Thr protein kinase)
VVGVTSKPDFFVSYTSVDWPWAVWIAWQLEADGYVVVVQAWDFTPGRDWVHLMQSAASTAERVVAVLSPDYLRSEYGEAEWRPFYAQDPSGELALLLPVRVREVDPPGLLRTKVYLDLVGRDVSAARDALLAAARGVRGKPAAEPLYPGMTVAGSAAPQFPPELSPDVAEPQSKSQVTLRSDDVGRLTSFSDGISSSLFDRGFSDSDVQAFRISLRELVDNVASHVPADNTVHVQLAPMDRLRYNRQEGVALEVFDRGLGFDLDDALRNVDDKLRDDGDEHGLLRAYRLGSMLWQSTDPHRVGWAREKVPQDLPKIFESEYVVPFVFSYRHEAIRIWQHAHTFLQFQNYLNRSEAFMKLVFDPLHRPVRPYVGIAVIGQGWTGALSWQEVVDKLLHFATNSTHFDKEFILFADTGPSEQSRLRAWCDSRGIRMIEDESVLESILPPANWPAPQKRRFRRLGRS